jgi:dihydroorotate dehydrogenase
VTVNISSPNTKNLRALQSDEALDACWAPSPNAAKPWPPPMAGACRFVKIAPDLDEAQVAVIAATLQRHGMDGVIATNTTISRDAVKGCPMPRKPAACPAPRCSKPATASSASCAQPWAGFPIIGVGGILRRRRRGKIRPAPMWCRSTAA